MMVIKYDTYMEIFCKTLNIFVNNDYFFMNLTYFGVNSNFLLLSVDFFLYVDKHDKKIMNLNVV